MTVGSWQTTTTDALFGGAVVLRQPSRGAGYRVNVDAILLAAFAAGLIGTRVRESHHAVDLGAGVGAVGLSMLHFAAAKRVTMIEIDVHLADLAAENAARNGWGDCVAVTHGDVAAPCSDLDADLVVCNPPYVAPGRGRLPAAPIRNAKHGELDVFLDAARAFTGRRARACFVYPAMEAMTLLVGLRARGLEPKRLGNVHAHAGTAARVILVEAIRGRPGGLVIEPPFIERGEAGPSDALDALLRRPHTERVRG